MDSTQLAILGMIAAFITASVTPSLTEWIKAIIQNSTRVAKIRKMLYAELAMDMLEIDTTLSKALLKKIAYIGDDSETSDRCYRYAAKQKERF